MEPMTLAADFPPADLARWRALAEKALSGKPIEALTARTYDGVAIAPLYTAADAPAGRAIGRARTGAWDIRQAVSRADPLTTNGEILADLEGGVTSIELKIDRGDGRGVRLDSEDDLARALDGVMLDLAPIALDRADIARARLLADYAARRNLKSAALSFNVDPIGAALRGEAHGSLGEALAFAKEMAGAFPNATALRADARAIHEAGGTEAQELAALLSAALAHWRTGEAAGLAPAETARTILCTLAVGPDVTLEIAKLRAARLIWARALEACGGAAPMRLQAVSGRRMMTRRDTWVNMLRVTAAGFASGVGGADIVTTAPLTEALGQPTPFARRIARNTQILLLEESNLARVGDPASGAWAFEALTDELARAAWKIFQELERRGGLIGALDWFAGEIAAAREARMKNVRRRKEAITGVSEFPLIGETEVTADPWPAAAKQTAGLPEIRLAAPFERLRDSAERAGDPPIFLATLGALPQFNARALFAKSLFEAGGLKALGAEDEHADDAALVAAFRASGAKLACLCSSDALYAERAGDAAQALKRGGCRMLFLAGRAGEEAVLRRAGVDAFVFAGCDAIEALEAAHEALGLAKA
jgi:methylmalonyl-CoA mutase